MFFVEVKSLNAVLFVVFHKTKFAQYSSFVWNVAVCASPVWKINNPDDKNHYIIFLVEESICH